MTNIQGEVTNFIEQDVSIRRGLSRGLLNSRALAKYISQNLKLNCTIDAVISAIRRYESKAEPKEYIKERYKLIASAKVSSRTKMISVLLKKNVDVRKSITNLYNKVDFSKGEVIRILEVNQYIKLIVDEANFKDVQELFSKSDVVSIEKGLGEISVIYGAEVANTPGVFAAVSGEYALSNISLVDAVICGNEHIFIVNEDDLMKALEAMHRIRKWGEKVKG
jgi:aspartokinase